MAELSLTELTYPLNSGNHSTGRCFAEFTASLNAEAAFAGLNKSSGRLLLGEEHWPEPVILNSLRILLEVFAHIGFIPLCDSWSHFHDLPGGVEQELSMMEIPRKVFGDV